MQSKSLSYPFDTVYEACLEAAGKCDFDIGSKSRNDGEIKASTDTTILSWGEEIRIEISRSNTHQTKVSVDSSPKSQLIDWGKSEMNEQEFIDKLDVVLEEQT